MGLGFGGVRWGIEVRGFWFLVSGFWFLVSGVWIWSPVFRFRVPGSGFQFRVSDFGFRVSGFGFRFPVFSFGCQVSGLGFPHIVGSKPSIHGTISGVSSRGAAV